MGGRAVVHGKDSGVFSDVTVLKGWSDSSRYFTSNASAYNKMYFDFSSDYVTTIGEVFDTEIMFEVGVENNSAPVFVSPSDFSVNENNTYVGQVVAVDAQLPEQAHTYSITGGADADKFTIEPTTGKLYFVSAPDYENSLQTGAISNKYMLEVTAVDDARLEPLSTKQIITVSVLDVTEEAESAPANSVESGSNPGASARKSSLKHAISSVPVTQDETVVWRGIEGEVEEEASEPKKGELKMGASESVARNVVEKDDGEGDEIAWWKILLVVAVALLLIIIVVVKRRKRPKEA